MGACQMCWREGEDEGACADGKSGETNGQGQEQMRQQARGAGLRRFILYFYCTARVGQVELRPQGGAAGKMRIQSRGAGRRPPAHRQCQRSRAQGQQAGQGCGVPGVVVQGHLLRGAGRAGERGEGSRGGGRRLGWAAAPLPRADAPAAPLPRADARRHLCPQRVRPISTPPPRPPHSRCFRSPGASRCSWRRSSPRGRPPARRAGRRGWGWARRRSPSCRARRSGMTPRCGAAARGRAEAERAVLRRGDAAARPAG